VAAQSPTPERWGDENVYHLVLREVTAIATNIVIGRSHPALQRRLFAESPLTMCRQLTFEGPDFPDVRESLAWARHALRSLVAESWLLILWQVTARHYTLSLQ
jgi:hypothetical protein